MQTANELRALLQHIDHRGYPAYKDTKGCYAFNGYMLSIDHVQGDPFAAPSRVSVHIPEKQHRFPTEFWDQPWKRIALQDHILRLFSKALEHYSFQAKGSGKSGLISCSRCTQEILERTACSFSQSDRTLSVCMEIGFPANGRTINSRELIRILFDFLPELVQKTLFYTSLDSQKVREVIFLAEDQHAIREQLSSRKLTAFIANGSILPRESGISSRPMKHAVPFQSPVSMEITLQLPHKGALKGMGIPQGITLIVGGGYHGKSTLLKALETGVYNHISGDGREYVITENTASKIRSEDGRSICDADISLFINDLPNRKDTHAFFTEDASGSTSQAANVVESMEAGTHTFLIDEDTSATKFMVRDELMQRVVLRNKEPITPFIERIRYLYEVCGISSVIVAGSSGAYFQMADHILQMDHYVPYEITDRARKAALDFPEIHLPPLPAGQPVFSRTLKAPHLSVDRRGRIKLKTLGKDAFSVNRDTVDLRYLEQLVDSEQTTALSYCLLYALTHLMDGKRDLTAIVNLLEALIQSKGLASLLESGYVSANLAAPRRQEIFACFSRYRAFQRQEGKSKR